MIPFYGIVPYGSLSLTASSPPQSFTEPLSLGEVKSYLNLPERQPRDLAEDSLLNAFISAAREVAETEQKGRQLVRKQFDLTLDYFPCNAIELLDPLVSVDLFRYRDSNGDYTTLVENTDYIVDTASHPGIVTPAYNESWPDFTAWPKGAVLIRFTAGLTSTDAFWADAGQRVKVGMYMLISSWFSNRLPFDAVRYIQEYPFAVTHLLGSGALVRVR